MRFTPPFCPYSDCPSSQRRRTPSWHRHGSYRRRCDQRHVPRFRCLHCLRTFSSQTFRLDARLRKPWLDTSVAQLLCSKTTLRKIAEILDVKRRTVERRLDRFGPHCRVFHQWLVRRHRVRSGGLGRTVQMDELETFETDRRLRPVTVPVLIERWTHFVIHVETAPLPARGNLREAFRRRKEARELIDGPRRNESRQAVERTLRAWKNAAGQLKGKMIMTDKKRTYNALIHNVFDPEVICHARESSRAVRDTRNLLFPINHTNALLRDSLSRLVRRNWAYSKIRSRLERHLWLFVVFRNYVRGLTRREWRVSAAMVLGVLRKKLPWRDVLRWRWPFFSLHFQHPKGPASG